ncbi:MAG: CHAT domain-containing protein, partial [Holophagales bacterium]|nr:CHAT domain-containing protein [Holophagales bacterium]
GEVFEARGDFPRARLEAAKALDLFFEENDIQGQAAAYFAIARAERALGNLEIALGWQELAVSRVEKVRERVDLDVLRGAYGAWKKEYYELWIEILLEIGARETETIWAERAFEVAERSRARALVENLRRSRSLPDLSASASSMMVEEAEELWIEAQRAYLSTRSSTRSEEMLAPLRRRLDELGIRLAEARQHLHAEALGALSPKDSAVPSLDQIRAWLRNDTLLLEVSLGRTRSYLWLLGQEMLEVHPLPGREQLEDLARRAHLAASRSWQGPSQLQAKALFEDLSRMLLSPIAEHLGDRRLLIVAPGDLQYVPFAALPDPRSLAAGEASPISRRNQLVALPSASLLEILRRPRREPGSLVAVFSDPVTSAEDPRLASVSRHALALQPEEETLEVPRLRRTAREGADLLARIPAERRLDASGFEASRARLFDPRIREAWLIHFAAHGFVDPEIPGSAGLILSRYNSTGWPVDGLVFAHELHDLDLAARLIVLAACRTALGESELGGGLGSLVHAFFYAGASGAVVSLWDLDDEPTAELMSRFYDRLLGEGLEAPEALRRAQLSMAGDPRWSSPYYWAGFVFQGDWQGSPNPLAPKGSQESEAQ